MPPPPSWISGNTSRRDTSLALSLSRVFIFPFSLPSVDFSSPYLSACSSLQSERAKRQAFTTQGRTENGAADKQFARLVFQMPRVYKEGQEKPSIFTRRLTQKKKRRKRMKWKAREEEEVRVFLCSPKTSTMEGESVRRSFSGSLSRRRGKDDCQRARKRFKSSFSSGEVSRPKRESKKENFVSLSVSCSLSPTYTRGNRYLGDRRTERDRRWLGLQ